MKEITLTRPDDWHIHLRDGEALRTTVHHVARQFGRAIVMPNLQPPVTTTEQALAYQQRILSEIPEGGSFKPLMTLYLTDHTSTKELEEMVQHSDVIAIKLYPAGATTNAENGVTNIEKMMPVFERMETLDIPLLLHGEVTDPDIDIFDREKVFIDQYLSMLVKTFPKLRIVLEHITTKEAVDFVVAANSSVAATITPHHLLMNRNDLLAGGLRPHHYCLPILKQEDDRLSLLTAATSGNTKFFLGTDSAPHEQYQKETHCGCAGIYSAHAALELYAEAFEQADALHQLEAFASFHGADFYHLSRSDKKVRLIKKPWTVPDYYPYHAGKLIPLRANNDIQWQLEPI